MTFGSICFQVVETEPFKNIFTVVISRFSMTSLSVGPHSKGVVPAAKFAKSQLQSSKNKSQRYLLNSKDPSIDPCGTP